MAIQYRIEIQPAALRDMSDAVFHIAHDLKNPSAAEHIATELVSAIESLSSLPTRCPLHISSRPLSREYRKLRTGSYLIFFTVSEKDETVTIARVIYARRDLDERLS